MKIIIYFERCVYLSKKISVHLEIPDGPYTNGITELDLCYIFKQSVLNEILGYGNEKVAQIDYPDLPYVLQALRSRIYILRDKECGKQ